MLIEGGSFWHHGTHQKAWLVLANIFSSPLELNYPLQNVLELLVMPVNNCCYHLPSASGPCHCGAGSLIKDIPTAATGHFFLQFCGYISAQQIPSPALPNQLFVFQEEIFNGGNFYQICFPSASFTSSCGWNILSTLFSSLAPTSSRKFHGITIPLAPHCNKTLISQGTGSFVITGSPHLRAQGKQRVPSWFSIWITCFLNNVLRGTAFKLG